MRHSSFSRSTRQRLQKLTAFLTAVAIIAGFLPLGAVKVSANVDTVDCEVVVENEDNNNYTSQVAVQYMANPEADPNDDASWTDIAPNAGTSVYSFPVTAKDGDDIHVRFILSKVDGENDPRVITGFKATVGDEQIIPVVDERLSDDLCTLTVPFDTTAGVSRVAIRVSLPNNLEFTQTNESNKDFYQFLLNRNLGSLTIPSDKTLEIYGASVNITGNLVLQENAKLRIQNNKEGEQIISTGTLTAGSIVGANNATIMFESKANIPSGFTFYRWGESGPEEVDPSDIPDDMCWFELYYDAQESKWFLNEFDPFSFSVVVDDNSNLVGASLVYKAEYSLNGGTDWTEANFAENLPNNFSGLKNISGGTVTFDSANRDLKELFFRLPDDVSTWVESPEGSGNWIEVYPNVMFRITIMNADEFETTAVTIGGGDDKINLTSVTESGNIIFTSSALNTDVIPHDIRLTLDSGFNADDSYGAAFEIPCDNGWSISNEGKTVVFDCFDGNTISVTSTGNVVVERKDQQNGPTIFIVWSDKTDFSVTAANAPGYTAYHEKENDRLVMDENYKIDVTVAAKGYDNTVLTRVNFEMANLKIEGYDSISPNPDYWENNNPDDKDYTLTSDTYTVTFPHGTVTVELVDSDPTDNVSPKWSGYKETWHDDFDNTDHEAFKIETTAQVKLTFTPAEGYQIISNLELSGGDPETSNVALNLDSNNSCVISLGTEKNQLNDPFVQIGGPDPTGTPDPQSGNKVTFTGATGMTDTDTDDGIVVINYEHGSVTFTQGDGTMKDGDIFNPVWDSETKTVTIEFNLEASFTIAADPNYDSTCKINNDEQEYQETYTFAPSPNTNVDITFMGPTFVLEVGGKLKEDTTYEVDDTNNKITLTYDHGTVEITNYISLVEVTGVTPGGSSVVISYKFTLEGNSADVKFIPDEDYIFSGMHLDGKEVAPDDERINNCVLSLTGIDKNNIVSVEPRFDLTPELKIVKVNAGETIGYDSSTKTLTFSENGINKGTVTITNESDPFSGNPQQDSKITSDITFTITPGTVPESDPEIKYVCFVMLNNGQGIYFPEAGTYTLKASDLRSDPVEGNKNVLTFEFKTLAADQLAKVKFNGEVGSSGDYYCVSYIDAVAGVQLGSVKISKDAIESCDEETSTFTIKQDVSSLELTITPKTGYTPKLVEYGPEYGDDQTVTGEWTRELTLTNNNGTYSYTLAINPQGGEPVGLRVSFDSTKYLQSTVTYMDYVVKQQCAVEIGGNMIPGGDLNNKLVEYETPLSLDADENSKQYVKVENGIEYVQMQFSIPFNIYIEDIVINNVSYKEKLPVGYEALLNAFSNQYTNVEFWVPLSDSYVIKTQTAVAVFDEDPTKTTLAVGNFLWFYDESHKDNDDYVKNAYLEIVQVEYNGEIYSKDNGNVVLGSAISWDVIEKDGEIVGGEATLPAGSYVTMKLIPDYGTQLVSLGLNGGGFTADQNEMYTYSFYVGPGNFHLNADFEPVDDVVEASATAVDGGSIALGDGTVDNGTAVLYVGDANVAGAEKTNFENLAADEALEISSYLDISLDKVVYQGVSADEVKYDGDGKNVWTSGLNDLAKPATVTLTLTDDIGDGTVKVLHNHNGNLEVIDADYNPATKELTFETSSFSNYAIAYEKNAPVTYYDLWVGGIQVTSANASNVLGDTGTPTVVYDADTNTLTLNGATITGPDSEVLGWNAGGGIVYSGTEDFTIKVTGGTSTVTGGNNSDRSAGLLIADPRYVFSGSSNPCKTTIIIDEGATLTLVGGVPNSYSACSVGLLCDSSGGLTITGSGTLNATGSGGGKIGVSYGIYTQKKLTIDGPTVNASGAANSSVSVIVSVGIYSCGGVIINSGTVTTTAGYITDNRSWSYGIKNTNNAITINGGTLTASGYSSALSMSPTLGEGVTASGSTNIDGSDAVSYVAADNSSYKWFSTSFTPLTYGISLDKTGTYTFTEATVEYSALTPVTVTVTNTGTGATGNLSVELSGSNPGCFTLSKTSLSGIAANGSDTFTIVPNTGLAPATYSTTVTVTGENNISATFKVSFKVNPVMYAVNINGGIADKETAAAGETVTVYADSIPEGKEFDKWVADSDDVVFYNASAEETNFTMPAEDVEITATFKDIKYTVTFNANGHGTAPAAQSVTYGGKATKPADLTATGWTFGGWYTDAACTKAYVFSTAVTGNITLYAKWTAAATPTPTPVTTPTATPTPAPVSSAQLLVGGGQAHVQDIGDTPVSVDPNTGILTIGTTGQGKRLEEITIDFENTTGLSGTMEYRVHVQDIGWMDWTEAGNPAGTEGISKRIEAIEIRLTGELAEYYSVEYCVHIQDYGDMQGWVADGALAGTTGESKRIEQIKVRIVPKGSGDSMSVKYRVHIEDFGWEGSYASGGAMSGTSGQSKRLEAIEIFLTGGQYSGGIKYKTHVQDIGWESSYAQNGEMSGTQGQAKRLEGISIELYGEVAEYYDIYYRVHAQDIGWMGWAKNGEYAGTAGRSARLEGIQIVLVPKGGAAPGATYNGITAATDKAFIEGF